MSKRVLVTGCGGDIGQSICKILIDLDYTVYGLDSSDKNAAPFIINNFHLGLKCSHKDYLKSLEKFIDKNKIDIIIPISEAELRFFTQTHKDLTTISGAKILMANLFAREICFDKLKTSTFLQENSLPYPNTINISDKNINYPIIGKSRTGSGSSKVFIIKSLQEYEIINDKYEDFLFQELLDDTEGEFTCGLFRSSEGKIRTITFKRELSGGYSCYGEIVKDQRIDRLLLKIGEQISLIGSVNVQLRLNNGFPTVFEINPRFSSTVLFRHLFGFKDVLWSIEDLLNENISNYNVPKVGRKFFKGFQEFIK